jgi:hypothetical protein
MPPWVVLLARILEGMFIVGSIVPFVVLVLSGTKDRKTLFGMDGEENLS